MKQIDYIIVGSGLAGIAFCEQAKKHDKTVLVIDNTSQKSSTVAGGLYNPVVLKRFTPVWKSAEQLQIALPFYESLEQKLQTKLDYKTPVYRLFNSVEEQNNWFTASDKKGLSPYLSTKLISNTNLFVEAPFGYGEVLETGRVDTKQLIKSYKAYLKTNEEFLEETFDYDVLEFTEEWITYKSYQAKHIVFAEGFGLKQNPFFRDLPLNGTKGELLTIHAPDLQIDFVLKSSVFIIPLGQDLYRIGATYEWTDKTNTITETAKKELLTKLQTFLKCDFTVVEQVAGIRPTVIDRRPLVGTHKIHKNLHVLNGLGTRGVMIAPYVAQVLFNHIENNQALNPEIAITRF